jgi:hypothetical protein
MFGNDRASWDTIKASFLQSFKQKYLAKTVCANVQDLMWKPGEAVFPYFAQNMERHSRILWPASMMALEESLERL